MSTKNDNNNPTTSQRTTATNQDIRRRVTSLPNFPHLRTDIPQKKYTSAEEYFKDLRAWMQQAYFWQSVTAAFPYYLMTQYAQANSNQQLPLSPQFGVPTVHSQPDVPTQTAQRDRGNVAVTGIECRIPPFWKRIVAEFIDFLILFFLKLGVTYVAIDFFDMINIDFYILHKEVKLEYKTILKLTEDIVILELVHRVVVCFFETFWLQGGSNGRIGGASPGKSVMGLRVVRCDSVDRLENNGGDPDDNGWVLVQPGTDLGLGVSFFRAGVKNFVLALFIPTSLAFFYFAHGRTGYDVVCSTIVVQEPLRQPTRPVQPQLQ